MTTTYQALLEEDPVKIEIHIDDNDRADPTVGDRPWAANLRGIDDANEPIFVLAVGFGATAAEAVTNLITELDTSKLDPGVAEQVQGFARRSRSPRRTRPEREDP